MRYSQSRRGGLRVAMCRRPPPRRGDIPDKLAAEAVDSAEHFHQCGGNGVLDLAKCVIWFLAGGRPADGRVAIAPKPEEGQKDTISDLEWARRDRCFSTAATVTCSQAASGGNGWVTTATAAQSVASRPPRVGDDSLPSNCERPDRRLVGGRSGNRAPSRRSPWQS